MGNQDNPDQEVQVFCLHPKVEDEKKRLDLYIQECIDELSRTRIQELIESYLIQVNGTVTKPSYRIRPGDKVMVRIPPPAPIEVEPEPYPLKILYEDSHLLVINKDKGVSVHPTPGIFTGTLVNYILHHSKDLSGIGGKLRPGIVHRLDKDTSGIILVAKSDQAHQALAEQFKERKVIKIYNAVVKNRMDHPEGYIRRSIIRDPSNRKRMAAIDDTLVGKTALTWYEVVENFKAASFLRVRIFTGRTHQIRVHFASMNHPLIGDPIYLKRKREIDQWGLALCAREITFTHPVNGSPMSFSIGLPDHIQIILQELRKTEENIDFCDI